MTDEAGALIIVEGTKGSETAEQYSELAAKLRAEGYDIAEFHFPRYEEASSHFVREYVAESFGPTQEVSPYATALFYAVDRFSASQQIKDALDAGKVVLCDRYVSSTMAQQATRISSAEERRGFYIWLDNLEYEMLGMPRPTMSFILTTPPKPKAALPEGVCISQYDAYIDMCTLFPKDFHRVETRRGKQPLSAATISDQLWKSLQHVLPEKPVKPESKKPARSAAIVPTYVTPAGLDEMTEVSYKNTMDAVMAAHEQILQGLTVYSSSHPHLGIDPEHIAGQVLPTALAETVEYIPSEKTPSRAVTMPENFDQTEEGSRIDTANLVSYEPRNELEVARMILQERNDKSPEQVNQAYEQLSYEQKAQIITLYIQAHESPSQTANKLEALQYTFDISCAFADFIDLMRSGIVSEHNVEMLSPRYGYDVPEILESAGLAEQFEACFDASFALYGLLQQQGRHYEAQYTVLHGHRIHGTITVTFTGLLRLKQAKTNMAILTTLSQTVEETHPFIANLLHQHS